MSKETWLPPEKNTKIFRHKKFGIMRVLVLDEVWVPCRDIARGIDYKTYHAANSRPGNLFMSIPSEFKKQKMVRTQSGLVTVNCLSEIGIARFFATNGEQYIQLRNWIQSKVIPKAKNAVRYNLSGYDYLPSDPPYIECARIPIAGYLYALYDYERGQCKIGCSKNPNARLYNLISSCHAKKNERFISAELSDAFFAEKRVHDMLKDKRVPKSEWFTCSFEEAVRAIKSSTAAMRISKNNAK